MISRIVLLVTGATLVACSSTKLDVPNVLIEDFVIASQLEAVDRIRTRDRDSLVVLNNRYIIYKNRRQSYLFKFQQECKALTNMYQRAPDLRLEQRSLRARVDTLRGCFISHIYPITTDQRKELKTLSEATAS